VSEPRKARTPLLERTVPFLRLPADLVAAAAVFGLLSTVGALELAAGNLAAGAVLMAGATAVAVGAILESMRRERNG